MSFVHVVSYVNLTVSTLKFRMNWRQLVRPLASAFLSSTDVPGTVALLKLAREAWPSDSDCDLVGQFVLEVASSKKSQLQAEQLLALLKVSFSLALP